MSRKQFLGLSQYLVLAIVLVSLLTLLIPVSVVKADSVVTFPDPNLEAAIRLAIHKPTGDIYESDLSSLTSLVASDRGITDLTGLEYCTSLTSLVLYMNHISDLSPLSGLTSLTQVTLDTNQISDLSPLSGLVNLTYLRLGENQISNIAPLSSLTDLTNLDLVSNQVTNLTPLSYLTSLTHLDLAGNQISDLSPLSGLSSLYTLDLQRNQISDLLPLSSLSSLVELYLYNNQISDLSPLSGLTGLYALQLQQNRITDLSPLSNLTWLGALDLQWNYISDVGPLVNNPGLGTHGACTVELGDNPLSFDSIEIYVPQLQARGINVPWIFPAGGSVFTATGTGTVVFEATESRPENLTISAVSIDDIPAEGRPNLLFPDGLLSFSMRALRPGDTVTIQLTLPPLPSNTTVNAQHYQYWKYGPTPSDYNPHWYEIPMSQYSNDKVLFQVTDGGLGDDDLTANGVIVDQGGPGYYPTSGCFIATAAYGTPMAEEIQVLREFRDRYLITNPVGKALVEFYYKTSPPIAEFITEHPALKPVVRAGLVPVIAMSRVAVSTTLAQKIGIVGSMMLLSTLLVIWFRRRAGKSST